MAGITKLRAFILIGMAVVGLALASIALVSIALAGTSGSSTGTVQLADGPPACCPGD
jgi:hypothetical protein